MTTDAWADRLVRGFFRKHLELRCDSRRAGYTRGMRGAALVLLAALGALGCRNEPATSVTIVTASGTGAIAIANVPVPAIGPAPAPRSDLVAIREDAHAVLSARCGDCHESHRTTAKPAALAIFDLDHADWPSRFDEARFAAGLRRFGAATAEDRAVFVAFRDAELAQR